MIKSLIFSYLKLIGFLLASPLSVPTSMTSSTLLISSDSIESVTLPSPVQPSETLSLSSSEWSKLLETLSSEGAATKQLAFAVKGSEPTPAPSNAATKAPQETSGNTLAEKEAAALAARKELEGKSGVQLGLTVKKEQAVFGEWYSQVLLKGDMLDYYDISGCYILKPWSYGIWQEIQS